MEKNLVVVRAQRALFVHRMAAPFYTIPYNACTIASRVHTARIVRTQLMDGAQVSTDRFRLAKQCETMPRNDVARFFRG